MSDFLEAKLNIMKTLNEVGFKKEVIAYTLLRMETFDEHLGTALWNSLTVSYTAEENVENKENVENNQNVS
jgi:hypothetical protein